MKKIFTGEVGKTISQTKFSFKSGDKTPPNAPNVVYIVVDDMGFSDLGCYGSEIETPNIDKLAGEGLRYNNFHTTAICSATRASLLTGANHHAVGINAVIELTNGAPNAMGRIDHSYATVAEILKEYDYDTFAVGKWHLVDYPSTTQAGPFTEWPLGRGFDRYYGYLQAQIDQFHPSLVRDNSFVDQPKQPEEGYHLSEDLTDKAIEFVFTQKAARPETPFFLYLAYGAVHAPHQAPREYIERYRGKFDKGWDALRRERFERQKAIGIIPENAELTPRSPIVRPWDEITDENKRLYAKYMEAFAGFLTHTDDQIGRFIDYLREIDQLDNTVIVFLSDNGASPEGGKEGRLNNYAGIDVTSEGLEAERARARSEQIGTQFANNHYPHGWAHLGNTPFKWYKTWVHSGGVKDALIIRDASAADPGGIRGQYHHVSDITPAILERIGVEKPASVKGVAQKPFTGTSLAYTLTEPNAPTRKHSQFFEMMGNRAIYKDGWKAVVNHTFNDSYDDDVWELYHVDEDFSENRDLAESHPEKLRELQEEWLLEAGRNGAYPMQDFGFHARLLKPNETLEKLKNLVIPERDIKYGRVIKPIDTAAEIGTSFLSAYTYTFRINRKTAKDGGVLLASGDRFGGFSLYIKDNILKYVYNFQDIEYYAGESGELPAGELEIKLEFTPKLPDTEAAVYVDGKEVIRVKVKKFNFRQSYYTTIGENKFFSVTADYDAPFAFGGEILSVRLYSPEFSVSRALAELKALSDD